jgi:hypothetical protein
MTYRVIKTIKGRRYLYEQTSYREAGQVRTKCRCLESLDTPIFVNTTDLGLDKIKPFHQPSLFDGELGRVRIAYEERNGEICFVEQLGVGRRGKIGHITLHPSGEFHRHGIFKKYTRDEAIAVLKQWIQRL